MTAVLSIGCISSNSCFESSNSVFHWFWNNWNDWNSAYVEPRRLELLKRSAEHIVRRKEYGWKR